MNKQFQIAVMPGDGVGPEIMEQALRVLKRVEAREGVAFGVQTCLIGGAALDAGKSPLPEETLKACQQADAVLLGAVGGPRWDQNPAGMRPENGLLEIRGALGLYANLRPARIFHGLLDASTLKPEIVADMDLLVVRELTGGIYFGVHEREGDSAQDIMGYSKAEVRRIARVAFGLARGRKKRVCSVDKANVLETSRLWRDTVVEVAGDYPDISLSHMYVDNAAMQLVRAPKQFDVILTGNLFGDILSDQTSMLTGSIGMLPSASLGGGTKGLYEPIHGSAPDIAGQNTVNPLAMILSLAMMLRHSFNMEGAAGAVEQAVQAALGDGLRTPDIWTPGTQKVSCGGMGDTVLKYLQ